MNPLLTMIKTDIRFQFLHGFYYVYLFLVIVYILLLQIAPASYLEPITISVIFMDPTLLGCFFIGGIVLLEKSQGVYGPLFMTGLRVRVFILAKVLSLSIISVTSSLFILLFIHRLDANLLPVLVSVFLCSIVFTLIGLMLAVRVRTVNQFLLCSPLVITVFFVPIVSVFEWWSSPVLLVMPSYAGIMLLEGAFRQLTLVEVLYAFANLLTWIFLLFYFAEKAFRRHILVKGASNE